MIKLISTKYVLKENFIYILDYSIINENSSYFIAINSKKLFTHDFYNNNVTNILKEDYTKTIISNKTYNEALNIVKLLSKNTVFPSMLNDIINDN